MFYEYRKDEDYDIVILKAALQQKKHEKTTTLIIDSWFHSIELC